MRFLVGALCILGGYTLFYCGYKNLVNGGQGPTFLDAALGHDDAQVGKAAAAIGGLVPSANQTGQTPQTQSPSNPVILA